MEVFVVILGGELIGAFESEGEALEELKDRVDVRDLDFELEGGEIVARLSDARVTSVYV